VSIALTKGSVGAVDFSMPAVDLQSSHRIEQRRQSARALLMALPLLVFLLATFVYPIGRLLMMSVVSDEVADALPATASALNDWPGPPALPDAAAFAALAHDISEASARGALAPAARRLNNYEPGFRSLLLKTARQLPLTEGRSAIAALPEIDPRWGEPETWRFIRRASARLTPDYLLAALDRTAGPGGAVRSAPHDQVHVSAFLRTFAISGSVTLICLLLGYPVAHLLASLPARKANLLMLLVIVPFWTSLLVRTTAWYVVLQPHGVLNSWLLSLGLIREPLALMFNRAGVLIGMTHILLPFMILANYAVMRGIPESYMRAAISLGAHPAIAFLRVYLPQTLPGIGAGCFLVFVLALGYYITPALLGGAGDEMISQLIALQMDRQLNWGLAGALSVYLVMFTLAVYAVFNRLIGVDRIRLS
jgi:putative spermidine/putrescine transport system permease protein